MSFAVQVPLRNKKGEVHAIALIDDVDAAKVFRYSWCLALNGYPMANVQGKRICLHRFLVGVPGMQVDHINRNKLDCRRENLRIVTDRENKQNVPGRAGKSSRFRGVSWSTQAQKWEARFGRHHRKQFRTEAEAAAYIERWRLENLPFACPEV